MHLTPTEFATFESQAAERARWASVLAPVARRAPRARRSLFSRLFGL